MGKGKLSEIDKKTENGNKIKLTPGNYFLKGYRGMSYLNVVFVEKNRPTNLLLTKDFSESYLDITRVKKFRDDD